MNKTQSYLFYKPEFDLERSKFENFLRTFEMKAESADPIHGNRKYMTQLQRIANKQSKCLEILKEDLEHHFYSEKDALIVENILKNTKRYLKLFYEAVANVLPQKSLRAVSVLEIEPIEEILMNQRMANLQSNSSNSNTDLNKLDKAIIPPEMLRT